MNKIIRTKYSFSEKTLRDSNIKISDIFNDITNNDTIIINDNNLFGYIEVFKEAKKRNFNGNILLTYHLNNEQNIIINSIAELELLTSMINKYNQSTEIQSLNNKTGILSTDKLNELNKLLEKDEEINKKLNIVNNDNLLNLNLSSINNEIQNHVNNLTFDNFLPNLNPQLTKEDIIKKLNQKLGYNEDSNFENIRQLYIKKYKEALPENKILIEQEAKIALKKYNEYMNRIDLEWNVTSKFIKYIHFVSYLVNTLKDNNLPVGPGRGSAPSSLICYALNISEIDPIEYNLDFSRFLNEERMDYPDIDIDIPAYVREMIPKLLPDFHFVKIQTMSNIKIVTQLKNLWEKKQNNDPILNIREDLFLINSLKKVIKELEVDPNLINLVESNFNNYIFQKLEQEINKLPEEKFKLFKNKILEINDKIKNFQGTSIHASGYIILSKEQYKEMSKLVTSIYNDGVEVFQASKECLEAIGAQKYDLLALSYLDIINNTKKQISNYKEINYKAKNIEEMDEATLKTVLSLANNGNRSLFQLDSFNIQIVCMKVFNEWINSKSDNKKDLLEIVSDIIAIIRPGVVQNNIDLNYINNLNGGNSDFLNSFKSDKNIYDKLVKIFPLGNLIYQEDVMMVAKEFGVKNADSLRRAMAKKNPIEMEKQREIFINSALSQNNNFNKNELNKLFNTLANYSEYCFNKSHSISYAKILLETANLFSNYPKEYIISYLNQTDKFENVVNIIKEGTERGCSIQFIKEDKTIKHHISNDNIILNINNLTTSAKFDKDAILKTAISIGKEISTQKNWKSKILSDPMAYSQKSHRLINSLVHDNSEEKYLLKNISKEKGQYGEYYKYEFSNGKLAFDKKRLPLEIGKIYKLNFKNRNLVNYKETYVNNEKLNFSTYVLNQNGVTTNPLTNDTLQSLPLINKNGLVKINGTTNGIDFEMKIETFQDKKKLMPIKQENIIQLW